MHDKALLLNDGVINELFALSKLLINMSHPAGGGGEKGDKERGGKRVGGVGT